MFDQLTRRHEHHPAHGSSCLSSERRCADTAVKDAALFFCHRAKLLTSVSSASRRTCGAFLCCHPERKLLTSVSSESKDLRLLASPARPSPSAQTPAPSPPNPPEKSSPTQAKPQSPHSVHHRISHQLNSSGYSLERRAPPRTARKHNPDCPASPPVLELVGLGIHRPPLNLQPQLFAHSRAAAATLLPRSITARRQQNSNLHTRPHRHQSDQAAPARRIKHHHPRRRRALMLSAPLCQPLFRIAALSAVRA